MALRRSAVQKALKGEQLEQYQLRLIDVPHYTLESIQQWLIGLGIKTSTTAIHRDRKAALAGIEAIQAKRDLAVHMVEMAKRDGWDVSRLNVELAGQMIFDALSSADVGDLNCENANQMIRLLEATAKLRTAESRAKVVDLERAELEAQINKAKNAARAAASQSKDKRIDAERVCDLLDKITKGEL